MKIVKFELENEHIKDFIKLYNNLYNKKINMQNDVEVIELLNGQHILSKYFKLHKFCIYNDQEIVGRFVLTEYPEDKTLYLGFFECIDDSEAAAFIFANAEKFAKENKYDKIVGPVDASFWLRYRLKINKFDKPPYTGEPYNQPYYLKLFMDSGYFIIEHYTSSIYPALADDYKNKKCVNRYNKMTEKGYNIVKPTMQTWNRTINEIYNLITALYTDFPVYKHISQEDFKSYFESYKQIINFDMVRMAYFHGKAVGFYISIPNYSALVYNTKNVFNILKILKIQKKPKEYIMLYMGIDKKHKGLGNAMIQSILETLKTNRLPSISALQRDGNISQSYVRDLIESRYEYVLLSKDIIAE